MSFTFEARTLLELGKELISNDDIALYELIKNGVDAGSPKVTILVQSRLPYTDYREACRRVQETSRELTEVTAFVDSRMSKASGYQSSSLVSELNRTTNRRRYRRILDHHYGYLNTITIGDRGEGMALGDLEKIYLRIGTRHRRQQNESGGMKLGDKGIGRLSAMRLGERLVVKTTKEGEKYWNVLKIDWGLFSHSNNMLVEDVELKPEIGERKEDRNKSGTIIRISKLNADWSWVRFKEILSGRIARFVDPFEAGLANRLIIAKHNGRRALIPSVPIALRRHAHAVCRATFRFEGGDPVIEGSVDYREKQRKCLIEARGSEVMTLNRKTRKRRAKRGHAAFTETPISFDALRKLGGFQLECYWYNRLIVDAIENLTENRVASRREIAHWSGGPMLYRHGFRVLPYGDPTDDWLSLDRRAFGASGFKLNRQQLFGRVRIETAHRYLSEQTNREGLVQSEVSDALKGMVAWIVNKEFRNFINKVDDEERIKFRKEQLDNDQIAKASNALQNAIRVLENELDGDYDDELKTVRRTARLLQKETRTVVSRLDEVRKQSTEDREKFVYLAGIGLMTEFIFHELGRAVSHTMETIAEVGMTSSSLSNLNDQLNTLHKRISAFDELTGEKRQTKSHFDMCRVVKRTLANHKGEFTRHGIRLVMRLPDDAFMVYAVRGMAIQIVENLVVNAAYWLKRQNEYENNFQPELTVTIDPVQRQLRVQDNGPGVPVSRKDRIFDPFVTTKPAGMGRGLGLYIARDMAKYHKWSLEVEAEVGRVRCNRLNGFVLEMSQS